MNLIWTVADNEVAAPDDGEAMVDEPEPVAGPSGTQRKKRRIGKKCNHGKLQLGNKIQFEWYLVLKRCLMAKAINYDTSPPIPVCFGLLIQCYACTVFDLVLYLGHNSFFKSQKSPLFFKPI